MKEFGNNIQERFEECQGAVLAVTGNVSIESGASPLLQRAMRLRNPYVDVLNVLQVEALRRLREGDDAGGDGGTNLIEDGLLVTINGIAAGMRNSGGKNAPQCVKE